MATKSGPSGSRQTTRIHKAARQNVIGSPGARNSFGERVQALPQAIQILFSLKILCQVSKIHPQSLLDLQLQPLYESMNP